MLWGCFVYWHVDVLLLFLYLFFVLVIPLGDYLLEKYIKDDERLDMNMVWTVVDLYKEAIILTRENDAECEAMALSRLGSVFDKVVKGKFRAKPYMMRSIQMAMSLHPRTFDSEGMSSLFCVLIFYLYTSIHCFFNFSVLVYGWQKKLTKCPWAKCPKKKVPKKSPKQNIQWKRMSQDKMSSGQNVPG